MNTSLTIAGGRTLHAVMNYIFGAPAPAAPVIDRDERTARPRPAEVVRGAEDGEGAMSDLSLEREDPALADPDEAMCRLSLSREEPGMNAPDASMSWLSLSWEAPEPRKAPRRAPRSRA